MAESPSEEALRAAALARGMAHTARNLLSVVVSGLEIAQEESEGGMADPRALRDALADARAAALRTAELVNRVALVFRAPTLPRAEVDITGVVASCEGSLRQSLRPHGKLTLLLAEQCLVVDANMQGFAEVIRELVQNAARANARAVLVEVVAEDLRDDGVCTVAVRVSDDGEGFTLPRVPYDPLALSAAGLEVRGLGLPLVFSLVRAWGGEVEVHSVVGEGTTVDLRLPGRVLTEAG